MGASPEVTAFGEVAVHAQALEVILWITSLLEPFIKRLATFRLDLPSMIRAVAQLVIDREKRQIRLTAAHALTAVGGHEFGFDFSTLERVVFAALLGLEPLRLAIKTVFAAIGELALRALKPVFIG